MRQPHTKKKLKKGDSVILLRDITRTEGRYARKGEVGTVAEVFGNKMSGGQEPMRWFAKVQIAGKIKTFRTTSLAPL